MMKQVIIILIFFFNLSGLLLARGDIHREFDQLIGVTGPLAFFLHIHEFGTPC